MRTITTIPDSPARRATAQMAAVIEVASARVPASQLVFPEDLRRLADELSGDAELHILDTLFGHDMFLKESIRVGQIIEPFLVARA